MMHGGLFGNDATSGNTQRQRLQHTDIANQKPQSKQGQADFQPCIPSSVSITDADLRAHVARNEQGLYVASSCVLMLPMHTFEFIGIMLYHTMYE